MTARRFHDLGLCVIQLKQQSKEPACDWKQFQTQRPADEQIALWDQRNPPGNVGIVLGEVSGLVVIESDTPEAEAWCLANLLPTPMATKSARGVHRYYRLPAEIDPSDIPATLSAGGLNIEIKRGGQYVVAPGSIHPSGHVYTEVEPWPTSLDAVPELSLALISDSWWPSSGKASIRTQPMATTVTEGGRNTTLFREGSRLRRLGMDESEIGKTLAVLNESRCNPPLDAAEVAHIANSCAKYEPAEDLVREAVEELNETYTLVDVGTETVVSEEVAKTDGARSWTEHRFRSFEDFRKKLVKRTVTVGKGVKPLADVWLKHPQGNQYDRLVYAPEGSGIRVGPNDLNGWKGFTVIPAPGNWSLTRDELLHKVICRGDQERFKWLLDWMAALFQKPGRHAETALILTGPQGIGKNVFADAVLARTFDARHARVTTHTKQVLGEFNDILSGIVLLVLDEVGLTTAGEYNATKGLITGHTIDINRKGIRVEMERSMLHVLFLSNDEVPLKVAPDDRRFAFYHLSDAHQNDTKFFARIVRELDEEGGRAAMLAELMQRPVDWDRLRLAPDSEGKRIAKRESWTPGQWFFFLMLRDVGAEKWGNHFHEGKQFRRIEKAATGLAYRGYVASSTFRHDIKDDRTEIHRELQRLVPAGFDFNKAVSVKGVLVRDYWTLPDWPTFKDSFAAAVGVPIDDLLAAEGPTGDRDQGGEM